MRNKEILFTVTKKDLVIDYYSGHGAGGQKRNKCKNCCRIRHPESGAVATGQEERSKEQNTKNAFRRLAEHPKFKLWIAKRIHEINENKTTEQMVDEAMGLENLKIEMLKDDKWVPYVEENKNV